MSSNYSIAYTLPSGGWKERNGVNTVTEAPSQEAAITAFKKAMRWAQITKVQESLETGDFSCPVSYSHLQSLCLAAIGDPTKAGE